MNLVLVQCQEYPRQDFLRYADNETCTYDDHEGFFITCH